MVRIGNEPIKKISKCKTLGVVIDDQLLWRDHVNEINSKVSQRLRMIRRVKLFVTESVLATMHKSLVLLYFDDFGMVCGVAPLTMFLKNFK